MPKNESPHISPYGFREYDARWIYKKDINESGILDLNISEKELARRKKNWLPPAAPVRGWRRLYASSVQQANLGADLDFLISKDESFNK